MADWLDVFVADARVGDAVQVEVTAEAPEGRLVHATVPTEMREAMEEYARLDAESKAMKKRMDALRKTVESYGEGAVYLDSGFVVSVGSRRAFDTTKAVLPVLVEKLVEMGKYEKVASLGVDTTKLKKLAAEDPDVRGILTEKVSTVVSVKAPK